MVWPGGAALIEGSVEDGVARRVWLDLRGGGTLETFLESVSYTHLDVYKRQPTWKVLGKYALQSALPIAGIVIAIVPMDRAQRNWFDRQLGLQLVHWERRAAATTVRADLQDGERPPHRESVDQTRGPAFPERDAGVQTGSGPIVDLADPTTSTAPAVPALLFDPDSPASPPASPVGAPVAAASRPTVVLDTGETVRLDTPVLLGRDPGTIPAVPNARPHQVRDAERSLSKTHLAVGSDEAGVWVMDCHSTCLLYTSRCV